ncbi:MAG TPA: aminotransferase class I/II-fold pyridoxal phosphate-dependent enzyme [Terriglobales bacterium]|nr:aminotransferase class I/II-fold pyridoxal phosphate-dependent enzyme [Terriglobales bacterium]
MRAKESRRRQLGNSTLSVHAGEDRHGRKPLTTEIAQTSVFTLPGLDELRRISEGKSDAYMYTRYANPTTRAAELKIAALEGAEDCLVTASGMAATASAVFSQCSAGDEIVSMLDVYGGTLKLFDDTLKRFGVSVRCVAYKDLGNLERSITRHTRMLFLESPTNPTLRCVDLERLCAIGRRHKLCVVVDNTFATPILQKPLELGADLVMHSATKYLGGHSDVTAGALAGSKRLIDGARTSMKQVGGCLDPGASYLLLRGIKTLEIRVERACQNAAAVAEALLGHEKVERVMYPGFENCDGHEFAKRQMRDFGMMVSFEIRGGERAADRFINALELWYLATSLGGVESTVSYPALSSHIGLSKERLKLMDVTAATVRLSVGIENPDDLAADLLQALDRA